MKKSLVFIIILLLITLLTFPVVFAEEGVTTYENTNGVTAEVLSNMDNYMKLSNPDAIDKTNDFLAVANDKTLFVQPQADKKSAYYIDLITAETPDDTITKVAIIKDRIVVLVKNKLTQSRLIVVNTQNKNTTKINNYNSVYNITKNNQDNLIIVDGDNLHICNVEYNNIQPLSTYKLSVGTAKRESLKFINNIPYIISNDFDNLHECELKSDTNTLQITDKDTLAIDKSVKDYYVDSNKKIHYIDANNKLVINGKTSEEKGTFRQLLVEGGNIYATANTDDNTTADNGKVYVFDKDGVRTRLITSKGDSLYRFDSPQSVFSDGLNMYIADTNNKRIIKRDASNDKRIQIKINGLAEDILPVKVVASNGFIYFITNDNNLYKISNPITTEDTVNTNISASNLIEENLLDMAVYGKNILILNSTKVIQYDGENKKDIITNTISADRITTAVSTNYAYIINKSAGDILKYNLENTETSVWQSKKTVTAGYNYDIDFRGNLYVEKDGTITKYSQDKNGFTIADTFKILGLDTSTRICTAIDSVNANYYFTSIENHLLYEINGEQMKLVGTNKGNNYEPPSDLNIIKAGRMINDSTAYITPDNPESAREVQQGQIFLILAEKVEGADTYYYVMAEDIKQTEYINKNDLELFENIDMKKQSMTVLFKNVQLFKYPYKTAEVIKFNGKDYLDYDTVVTCELRIAAEGVWDWYKISLKDKYGQPVVGYVYAHNIFQVVPSAPSQSIIFMKTKAPKIGTNIIIYEKADLNSKVLFDDVKDGIDIQIEGEFNPDSTFTKVNYNGKIGYILTENLQANGLTPNQIIAISISSVAIVAFTIIAILFIHKNKHSKKKIENIEPDILS